MGASKSGPSLIPSLSWHTLLLLVDIIAPQSRGRLGWWTIWIFFIFFLFNLLPSWAFHLKRELAGSWKCIKDNIVHVHILVQIQPFKKKYKYNYTFENLLLFVWRNLDQDHPILWGDCDGARHIDSAGRQRKAIGWLASSLMWRICDFRGRPPWHEGTLHLICVMSKWLHGVPTLLALCSFHSVSSRLAFYFICIYHFNSTPWWMTLLKR